MCTSLRLCRKFLYLHSVRVCTSLIIWQSDHVRPLNKATSAVLRGRLALRTLVCGLVAYLHDNMCLVDSQCNDRFCIVTYDSRLALLFCLDFVYASFLLSFDSCLAHFEIVLLGWIFDPLHPVTILILAQPL